MDRDDKLERIAKAIALSRGHASANAMGTKDAIWECDGIKYVTAPKTFPVWTFYIEAAQAALKEAEL